VGSASITVCNGLARPVSVTIGEGEPLHVGPFGSGSREVEADRTLKIATRTAQGQLIERFDAEVRGSFARFIYNVRMRRLRG